MATAVPSLEEIKELDELVKSLSPIYGDDKRDKRDAEKRAETKQKDGALESGIKEVPSTLSDFQRHYKEEELKFYGDILKLTAKAGLSEKLVRRCNDTEHLKSWLPTYLKIIGVLERGDINKIHGEKDGDYIKERLNDYIEKKRRLVKKKAVNMGEYVEVEMPVEYILRGRWPDSSKEPQASILMRHYTNTNKEVPLELRFRFPRLNEMMRVKIRNEQSYFASSRNEGISYHSSEEYENLAKAIIATKLSIAAGMIKSGIRRIPRVWGR